VSGRDCPADGRDAKEQQPNSGGILPDTIKADHIPALYPERAGVLRDPAHRSSSQALAMTPPFVPSPEFLFDLLRGLSALSGNRIIADLARVVAEEPREDLSVAFNHKQIASKAWLRDTLYDTLGGDHAHILVLGGWYGVLPAMLLDDARFAIRRITTIDLDPACRPVAERLNRRALAERRFAALSADMNDLDYAAKGAEAPSLIVNTSCEHLADVPGWLARLAPGQRVVLQSNDYFAVQEHLSSVPDLDAFVAQAGLSQVAFKGALPTKNYTRFMLIGAR
jgi:hypothetical protein